MKSSKSRTNLQEKLKVHVPGDYAWKVLDALVDDLSDCLTESDIIEVKGVVRSRDYAQYLVLSEAWGPQSITSNDANRTAMYARYQVASLLKKFLFPADNAKRRETAKLKFKLAEVACGIFNLVGSKTLAFLEDDMELTAFTHARTFLQELLGHFLPPEETLTLWSRHGPGSNLDTKNRSVSMYDKYGNWPYSCTKDALCLARSAIRNDERWLGALEDDYRKRYDIPKHIILNQELFWSRVLKLVPGNRITFVPKNSQTDRSIAIEPCMNLYLQLGIDGFIRRRLKRWGVDLDDQTKNQNLARLGSLNWDCPESFVTLDLAAASDSISIETCRLLLPVQWFNHLMKLRSPFGDLDGETISYEKISSMGNGFTFALESAIFASIVYGCTKATQGKFDRNQVAVYGDDLVFRKPLVEPVVRMLNRCGFSVNSEKSFVQGPFRESCGADWFSGAPVRPVFLTTQPSTVMELWNDVNRLRRVLSLRLWSGEFKACQLISKWIPTIFADVTGPYSDESFDSYMHVPNPTVRVKNCIYNFKCLVVRPKPLRGDNFLFRKLMHSLRDTAPESNPYALARWGGCKVTGAGSRFTVVRSNAVTVGYTFSPASFWRDEYAELTPVEKPS